MIYRCWTEKKSFPAHFFKHIYICSSALKSLCYSVLVCLTRVPQKYIPGQK